MPIPSKQDIEVFLVPMDCGDFSYRYYLITVKSKAVVDNIYVEGEWNEPDDRENPEVTTFSIAENYMIAIKT